MFYAVFIFIHFILISKLQAKEEQTKKVVQTKMVHSL